MRLKPVPAESATRIALFFQLSVASRLLLAFLGISSMAVIAAAAAIYSFRQHSEFRVHSRHKTCCGRPSAL
jgi:hypothetical protein